MKHSDPSFKRLVLTFLLLYAFIALVPLAISRAQPMPVKGGSSLLEAASSPEPSLSSSGPRWRGSCTTPARYITRPRRTCVTG